MIKEILFITAAAYIAPAGANESQDAAAHKIEPPAIKTMREQSFDAVVDSTIPLVPDEIRQLNKLLDEQKRAAGEPVRPTIQRSRQVMIDLTPGAPMPTISVNTGYVSTIIILDRHGAPWPITNIRNGNARDFTIEEILIPGIPDEEGNVRNEPTNAFTIITKNYSQGNASIFLKGLQTPVIANIVSGDSETDGRIDLNINAVGPVTRDSLISGASLPSNLPDYDELMAQVLGGAPPGKHDRVILKDRVGDIFRLDGRVFLRSHYKLLSPSVLDNNIIKASDGTIVYEIPEVPLVLMVINGATTKVRTH